MAPRKKVSEDVVTVPKTTKKRTEKVQSKTDPSAIYNSMEIIQHIRSRPVTYIGAVAPSVDTIYTMNDSNTITKCKVKYSRGLLKIIDELVVNVYDQCIRHDLNKPVTFIDITFTDSKCVIINDGTTIPIVVHTKEDMYIPQMVFTKPHTSQNFNDTELRFTGGTNGIGAKATNIMSSKFDIFIINTESKYLKRYRQTCSNNMSIISEPIIDDLVYDPIKGTYTDIDNNMYSTDITSITTEPDFTIFKSSSFNDTDIKGLIRKRCYDLAYCCNSFGRENKVTIKLNGEVLSYDTMEQYIQLYEIDPQCVVTMRSPHNRDTGYTHWNIAIALNDRHVFDSVSFVNGINTYKGGTHVNYIKDQIVDKVLIALKKLPDCKTMEIDATYISKCIMIYVSMIQDKPAFNSQSKEELQTDPTEYTEQYTVPDSVIDQLLKIGLTEMVLDYANARGLKKMKDVLTTKKHDNLSDIVKYEGAEYAGTKNSDKATLILTEGDSAKAMVVSGIGSIKNDKGESIGRKLYGIFPMRGKLLNVRDFATEGGKISSNTIAGLEKMRDNVEIKSLMRILGLNANTKDTKSLRYGSIVIMTDADTDGSHIRGLIMNLINSFWSELFEVPKFMGFFITPIVIVKGNGVCESVDADGRSGTVLKKDSIAFYSQPDFERWKSRNSIMTARQIKDKFRGASCKYYKGLGTSSSDEAKLYFSNIEKHIKWYVADDTANERMRLAFKSGNVTVSHNGAVLDTTYADLRKEWLLARTQNEIYSNSLDYTQSTFTVSEFIDKELILFSMADNERSVPSVIDGMKSSQRKVLYSVFKRGMGTTESSAIKVAQLSGYVSEHSDYHHGEVSLQGTITSMASDFTGSNNINLMMPQGQFGSRHANGGDAASPRYTYTYPNRLTPLLFPNRDNPVLEYRMSDDGDPIEPTYYVPIIPMVLVNGTDGIGTGWSTFIPQYNPLDIVAIIKSKLNGTFNEKCTLTPWYRNFNGTITPKVTTKANQYDAFTCRGSYLFTNEHLVITELPIGVASLKYNESVLSPIVQRCEKGESSDLIRIKKVLASHDDNNVCFKLELEENGMRLIERITDHQTLCSKKKYSTGTPDEVIVDILKLESTINTSNMHCWDSNGIMHKYRDPNEIINEHFTVRLELYGKRKEYELIDLKEKLIKSIEEAKYIIMIISDMITDSKRNDINEKLQLLPIEYRFGTNSIETNLEIRGVDHDVLISELKRRGLREYNDSYNYLINMKQSVLVYEQVVKHVNGAIELGVQYDNLIRMTPTQMWTTELDAFVVEYNNVIKEKEKVVDTSVKQPQKRTTKKRVTKVV